MIRPYPAAVAPMPPPPATRRPRRHSSHAAQPGSSATPVALRHCWSRISLDANLQPATGPCGAACNPVGIGSVRQAPQLVRLFP